MTKKTNSLRQHFERTSAEHKAKTQADHLRYISAAQRQRINAAAQKPEPEAIEIPSQNADLIDLRFFADHETLKSVQSIIKKRVLKADLLPKYLPWIEGTLTHSPAPQNNVLMHLMVWALDAGSYALALEIATHGLLNDMVMPEPYTRDVATVFSEQLADGILEACDTAPQYSDILEQAIDLTISHDIVDQVRAKLFKAYGISIQDQRPSEALTIFETALRLDKNSGVKKMIEVLQRAIKRAATASAPDTQSGSQEADQAQAQVIDPASTALPNSTAEVAVRLDTELGGDIASNSTELSSLPEVPLTLEGILGLPEASDPTTKPTDTETPPADS